MRMRVATAFLCVISSALSATEHSCDEKNDAVRGASDAGDGQHGTETRPDTIDAIEEGTKFLEHKVHQRFVGYQEPEHLTAPENPAAQSFESFVQALNITLTNKSRGSLKKIMDAVMKPRAGHVCYALFGCFHPGNRMALEIGGPSPPRELGTKFRFYKDRHSRGVDAELLLRAMRVGINQWDLGKPLVVIIHGFMQHGGVPWVTNLKNALLGEVNANVVTVDWWKGAKFPEYGAAAANTPLVGAQLSSLLQEIIQHSRLRAHHVHLVGFSLGAHVAGFCGRHFRNITGRSLGRITGLDPAGPLFEGTNVSLSRTDTDFVDVIHTNAGPVSELKLGIQEPLGHVDFYPNGGSKQPECADDLSDPTCSHRRATELFTESITSRNCSFEAVACKHGWDGYRTCLQDKQNVEMVVMGYHCTTKVVRDPQYLRTNGAAPYCIPSKADDNRRTSARSLVKDPYNEQEILRCVQVRATQTCHSPRNSSVATALRS